MAYTEFYCQTTGNNLNAGSTTSNGAAYTSANGNWNGTSSFTPTDGSTPASTVSVGDFASIFLDAATVAVYVAQVTAVAAGVNGTITLSTTVKGGSAPTSGATGRTIKVGGAWKGPNAAVGFPLTFTGLSALRVGTDPPRFNYKNNATYNITAAISVAAQNVWHAGYSVTPGDGGKATIDGGTSGVSYVLITLPGAPAFTDFIVQNNGASGSADGIQINTTGRVLISRVVVNSVRGNGFYNVAAGNVVLLECETYACNQSNTANFAGFAADASATWTGLIRCVAHDNTGSNTSGFLISGNSSLVGCIADSNTLHGYSFITAGNVRTMSNCVAYGNGGSGASSTTGLTIAENCLFVTNGAYGMTGTSSNTMCYLANCAFYSNTSGQTNLAGSATLPIVAGSVTLTGDPFVDAANGDFDLNNTTGAGAACRGAGRGAFAQTAAAYAGTLSVPDIGASQHADSGTVAANQQSLILTGRGTY